MQVILNERHPPNYALTDINAWQQHMYGRIQEWYGALPHASTLPPLQRKSLEAFELTLHRAIFYLYHPSLHIPEPSEDALLALADAATHMIQLYHRFFRDHRLTIYWQAVENLFSAGNALLFTYVRSVSVRNRTSLRSLELLVRTCSSVLWGMVEHFPDFQGRRDAFDLTASQVLADINSSSTTVGNTSQSHVTNSYYDLGQQNLVGSDDSIAYLRPEQRSSTLEPDDTTTNRLPVPEGFPNDKNSLPTEDTDPFTFSSPTIYPYSGYENENVDFGGFDKLDDFLAPAWMQ